MCCPAPLPLAQPAGAAGGDATWQVTLVAAGAAVGAGLQPLLVSLAQSPVGPSGPSPDTGAALPAAAAAHLHAGADPTAAAGAPWLGSGGAAAETETVRALALDALAHLALARRGAAPAEAAAAAAASPPAGAPAFLAAASTAPAAAAAAAAAAAGAAAAAAAAPPLEAEGAIAAERDLMACLAQLSADPAAPLPQQAMLGLGMHLLAAPDYTTRRLGCNVVSLLAQSLAPLALAWREEAEGGGGGGCAQSAEETAAAGAAAAEAATGGGSGSSSITTNTQALVQCVERPEQPAPVQEAIHMYRSLAGVDEALAGMLRTNGARCRLSGAASTAEQTLW